MFLASQAADGAAAEVRKGRGRERRAGVPVVLLDVFLNAGGRRGKLSREETGDALKRDEMRLINFET